MSIISARHSRAEKVIAWALVVVWAVVIFLASAKSGLDLDTGTGPLALVKRWLGDVLSSVAGQPVDPSPIGHFGEYFVFGVLLANALRLYVPLTSIVLCAIVLAAVYAATDEFHQLFVPGRACDPVDWLVDIAAAAVGALLVWLIFTRR